ncbi:hypothetical protein BDP27DRAFT_1417883 [Rhodocollybia butyracea]|uniref:EF-hand domain-containing protein n=1 Tax=Rhodocollybia butyracea TaxID=206335 RepID=A0A9P5Q123_9AGAR|nr:hypothetical protein BDP27DRAFT_1417883 [Rhodocollybia butyracea]
MDMPVPQPATSLEQRPKYSETLLKIQDDLNAKPIERSETSLFNKIKNKFGCVNDNFNLDSPAMGVDATTDVIDAAKDAAEPITSALTSSVNDGSLSQFIDPFIDIIDGLSTIHPAIAATFKLFKAVYAVEKKRRENHQMVVQLYADMQNMLALLLRADDIKDNYKPLPNEKESQVSSVESQVQHIAEDIKAAHRTCEGFNQSRSIARVLMGAKWTEKFNHCTQTFAERKNQLNIYINMHSSHGIDDVKKGQAEIGKKVDDIAAKLLMFGEFMSSTERKISDFFRTKGLTLDDALLNNDDVLCDLYDIEREGQDFSAPNQQKSSKNDQSKSQRHKLSLQERTYQEEQLKRLKDDMRMDVDKILEQVDKLEARFNIELARQTKEVKDIVKSTGDRVIESLSNGPWEMLSDKEISQLWKYMKWNASVKSTHFVLAMRDFYHDGLAVHHHLKREERSKSRAVSGEQRQRKPKERAKVSGNSPGAKVLESGAKVIESGFASGVKSIASGAKVIESGFAKGIASGAKAFGNSAKAKVPHATIRPDDEWIIPQLRIDCLRSVLDAIDVDTSGFITVKEVEVFYQARPKDWSLLKWIAYWALGWKASMVIYYREIRSTLRAMFSVLQQVSPKNRRPVDDYLSYMWSGVMVMTMSLVNLENSPDFEDCSSYFTEYIKEEKRSLEEKEVSYALSSNLVADGTLVNQSLLPLLDILLKKHLKIIKLSTSTIVPPSSIVKALQDATLSIWSIWEECTNRARVIQANFKHQRRDVQQELKIFACGLYQYTLERHHYTPGELDLLGDFSGTASVNQDEIVAIEKELRDDSVIVTEDSNVAGDATDNNAPKDASTPLSREIDLPPSQTPPSETPGTAEPLPLDDPKLAQEILREWTGYIEEDDAGSVTYMHHYTFRASPSGGSNFDADGTIYDGESFSVSGTFSMDSESDTINVNFIKEYDPDTRLNYVGTFDRQTGELYGLITKLGLGADASNDVRKRRFCFHPVSPLVCQSAVCVRPTDLFSETATDFEIARQQLRDAHARNYERVGNLGEDLTPNRVKLALMVGDIYWRRQRSVHPGSVVTRKVLPEAMRNYYIEWDKEKDMIEEEAPHHGVYCDNCGEEPEDIVGSLIICVTCSRTDRGHVDLCSTVQCIDSPTLRTERGELAQPHEPSHGLLRLPNILHLGMESDALFRARRGLNDAKAVWEEGMAKKRSEKAETLDRESTDKKFGCRICWRKIVSPFWFCIDCSSGEEPVLLCNRCGVDEIHHDTHHLVRYSSPKEQTDKDMNIEQQLNLLSQQVQAVQPVSRKEMEQELKSLREDVQYRFDRIEAILTRLIPVEGSSQNL